MVEPDAWLAQSHWASDLAAQRLSCCDHLRRCDSVRSGANGFGEVAVAFPPLPMRTICAKPRGHRGVVTKKGQRMQSRIVALAVAVALALSFAPGDAKAKDSLTLVGHGSVSAPSDLATIVVGVETTEDEAADALERNSRDTAAVIAAAVDAGVPQEAIKTSSFSVSPRYGDSYSSGRSGLTDSYLVSNTVEIHIKDLDSLGDLLDRLVRSGANTIRHVTFGFQDPTALTDEARRLAVADAKRKAALFADATGVTLGPITMIREGGMPQPGAVTRTASAVPVTPGDREVSASVEITWSISQ